MASGSDANLCAANRARDGRHGRRTSPDTARHFNASAVANRRWCRTCCAPVVARAPGRRARRAASPLPPRRGSVGCAATAPRASAGAGGWGCSLAIQRPACTGRSRRWSGPACRAGPLAGRCPRTGVVRTAMRGCCYPARRGRRRRERSDVPQRGAAHARARGLYGLALLGGGDVRPGESPVTLPWLRAVGDLDGHEAADPAARA